MVLLIHTELRCTVNHTSETQSILYKYSVRTAQWTLYLGCENWLIVHGKNRCVFCEEHKKHKYTVRAERRILDAFAELRIATVSFFMSVCLSVRPLASNNSAPKGLIFMKFDIYGFLENPVRKSRFHSNPTRMAGDMYGEQHNYISLNSSYSEKCFRQNQNTFYVKKIFSDNRVF